MWITGHEVGTPRVLLNLTAGNSRHLRSAAASRAAAEHEHTDSLCAPLRGDLADHGRWLPSARTRHLN